MPSYFVSGPMILRVWMLTCNIVLDYNGWSELGVKGGMLWQGVCLLHVVNLAQICCASSCAGSENTGPTRSYPSCSRHEHIRTPVQASVISGGSVADVDVGLRTGDASSASSDLFSSPSYSPRGVGREQWWCCVGAQSCVGRRRETGRHRSLVSSRSHEDCT